MFIVGMSLCTGAGSVGSGPIPADRGNRATSAQPRNIAATPVVNAARIVHRIPFNDVFPGVLFIVAA
jgi:hypothetical protein